MTHLLALACAMPLALSHDLGGPLGLVALAPLMALSRHVDRPFAHGFLCGFTEVFLTMLGAADYSILIPLTLALQGGLARGVLAWAIGRRSGPLLPISVLVIGQGLRASSVLTLPLSTGHDLVSVPLLAWPAAFGGGALLTAFCGLCAYALTHPKGARRQAGLACGGLLLAAAGHQVLGPSAGDEIVLRASVIQGGLPNWVYRQAAIDADAAELIHERYLKAAAQEPADRLLILPETAVRQTWGAGSMSQSYRALHSRGNGLVAGVNRHFDGALRNSAMIWPVDQDAPRFQAKRALVPIVEREFEALDARTEPLPNGGSVMICIESVYPRYASPDSRWLLVLTNDAGVGRSSPRRAFERESRLRAIETGRSLLRAGQDGLSYALAPDGTMLSHLPSYRPGVLRIDTLPGPRATLRGQLGDWLFWLAWLCALGCIRRRSDAGERPA